MNFSDRFRGKTQIIDKNGIDAVVRKDQSQPINKDEVLKQMNQHQNQQQQQQYNKSLKIPYSERSLSLNNYDEKSMKSGKSPVLYDFGSRVNILNGTSNQGSNLTSGYSQYSNQFYSEDQQVQPNHLSQSQFSKQANGYQDFYQPNYQPDFSQNIAVSQDQTKRYNRQQFLRSPAYSQDYTQEYLERLHLKEKNAFTSHPNSSNNLNIWGDNPSNLNFAINPKQNFNSTLDGTSDLQKNNNPMNSVNYYKNPQIYYTPDKQRQHQNNLRPNISSEITNPNQQYYPNSAHSSQKNTLKTNRNEPPIFKAQQILDEQNFINRLDLREQIRSKMQINQSNNDKQQPPFDRKQYIYSQGKQYSENNSPLKSSQKKPLSINDSPTLINSGKRLLNDQIPRNQRSIKLQNSANY